MTARGILRAAALAWLAAVAPCAYGDGATATPAAGFSAVDASARELVDSAKIPSAAFAIVRGGTILHESAVGLADRERSTASTVRTPYPLASATKPIVATAVLMLHERGSIDIEAPARRYAGTWFADTAAGARRGDYSVRQVLNHSSGLPTYARIYWSDQAVPVRPLEAKFRNYGFLAQPPGAVSEYSNLGYGLLGHIVAEQSKTNLAGYLSKEVFMPLGMRDSVLVDSFETPAGGARKYGSDGKLLADTYNDTPGAGNVYASAHDLALFAAFHLGADSGSSNGLLSLGNRRLMRSYVDEGATYPYYGGSRYGLGWYFRATPEGEEIAWHEGGMPGASAIIVLLPKRNLAAVAVINATDANPHAQAIANALLKAADPDYRAAAFDATEGMERFSNQRDWFGRWQGTIEVDGRELPFVLRFDESGAAHAEFPDRETAGRLPEHAQFSALLRGELLLATIPATLPAHDVNQATDGFLLLRLRRDGDSLDGAAVAYASAERLEHLCPFAVRLRRSAR